MISPVLSFTEWLIQRQSVNRPRGDFARDVASDPHWPKDGNKQTYLRYLRGCGTSVADIRTFHNAWEGYRRYVKLAASASSSETAQEPEPIGAGNYSHHMSP